MATSLNWMVLPEKRLSAWRWSMVCFACVVAACGGEDEESGNIHTPSSGGSAGTGGSSHENGNQGDGGGPSPGDCQAPSALCAGVCVNTTSHPAHCSDCDQACAGHEVCSQGECTDACEPGFTPCDRACVDTQSDAGHCGTCNNPCAAGALCDGGSCTGGTGEPDVCDPGTAETRWAASCATSGAQCTPGTWTAWGSSSPENYPLRYESEHFAFYWPDGRGVTVQQAQTAAEFLENEVWAQFFGSPIFFPEPDCNRSDKRKTSIHIIESGLFGGCNAGRPGMWVGPGAITNLDRWGFAHEFTHAFQCLTPAFPDCTPGGGCWIYEAHANWMPHQLERYRDNVHCSDMLVNAPHLYYGSTRNRYCNWQFFEFLKNKHCYASVNEMWTTTAPTGQRDPWEKLMLNQGWNIEQLNDLFGEWAMHNVTWDYQNPPPTDGSHHGSIYRSRYGSIEDTAGRTDRHLRLTRLEALDESWSENRRFVSPYYWAPQRWGYNVVRLYPEAGADEVRISFRGVVQEEANPGWRWGLVATDADITTARYSSLQQGTEGKLSFCLQPGENLYLVVTGAPTEYQKILWSNPGDGTAYPSIYRYPYMVELEGAWPAGFRDGAIDDCPSGTERHENGGGCAPANTPASVYVGPYARILGGTVTGSARIEDQATIVSGTVTGGRIGALSLVGQGGAGIPSRSFNVSGSAVVQGTFYPLSWFVNDLSASGTAHLIGDLEIYTSKSNSGWYGLVDNGWNGVPTITEVTVPPPYSWRD